MCQLLGVSAPEPTRLRFSWEQFARRGSLQGRNPDGWGVAYVDAADAHVYREPAPAAESPHVTFLGTHAPMSTTVISHIRHATLGGCVLANTQPFVRALGGRMHVFAHNGHVSLAADAPSGPWLRPVGDTDSERMFLTLMGRMERVWRGAATPSLETRTEVVADFAQKMRERGAANFLYSDGLTLFAHGHRRTIPGAAISEDPGLHLLLRSRASAGDGHAPCDGIVGTGPCAGLALVATVPLDDQPWRPLSVGELLRLEGGAIV